MDIGDIGIGAIIFIVFVIISIAQKIKERADLARGRGNLPRSMEQEGAPVREATPKSAPAQEIMEALFGAADRVDVVEEEAEGEWAPLAPDTRRELPQRVTPPPVRRRVTAQHVESRVQHDRDHEGATTREESIRHQQAQKARKRQLAMQRRDHEVKLEQQRAREEGSRRRRTPKVRPTPPTPPTPRQKRGRLFSGAHEVRKAIVFAEILGPPKAFED